MQTSFACGPSGKSKQNNTAVAIYHLSVKTVSRSAGRSATAAAAYRSGARITDERTGEVHDYTRKSGVESARLVLPVNAPEWAADRAALWNAAEEAETRKNSTVAREFEIALPAELSPQERERLAVDFAREVVDRHGCAADVAIHVPGNEGDNRNHHAHILVTTRRLTAEGFTEKTRELDDRKTGEVARWRERFADLQNERLRESGSSARVDHRSLAEQGIEREPSSHLGPAVAAMERRGIYTEVRQRIDSEIGDRLRKAKEAGDLAREVEQAGAQIISLSTDIERAKEVREEQRQAVQASLQRIDALTAGELGAYIEQLKPPDVRDLVNRDQETQEAHGQAAALERQYAKEAEAGRQARTDAQEWRKAHPLRAQMHDAGLIRSEHLTERERAAQQHGQRAQELAQKVQEARETSGQVQKRRWDELENGQAPARERLAILERLHQAKEAREAQDRTENAERKTPDRTNDSTSVEARLRAAKDAGEREREEPRQRPPSERMR